MILRIIFAIFTIGRVIRNLAAASHFTQAELAVVHARKVYDALSKKGVPAENLEKIAEELSKVASFINAHYRAAVHYARQDYMLWTRHEKALGSGGLTSWLIEYAIMINSGNPYRAFLFNNAEEILFTMLEHSDHQEVIWLSLAEIELQRADDDKANYKKHIKKAIEYLTKALTIDKRSTTYDDLHRAYLMINDSVSANKILEEKKLWI